VQRGEVGPVIVAGLLVIILVAAVGLGHPDLRARQYLADARRVRVPMVELAGKEGVLKHPDMGAFEQQLEIVG
jgi:hypothetical protein